MQLRAMKCTTCGAALPPRSRWSVIDCSYCGARMVLDGSSLVRRADYREALRAVARNDAAAGAVTVGSGRYLLRGRLGQGESTDAFLAERLGPLRERVVVKVLRADADADLMRRERDVLDALSRSDAQGAPYFSTRIPQVVAFGTLDAGLAAKPQALVHRDRSGFVETLGDLASAFPGGLDARHIVWILHRVLETLDWVHRSGYVHGAILPQHLLINARDHGVALLGWSCAVRPGEPLPALASSRADFYPAEAARGGAFTVFSDLVMTARCAAYALTGDARRLGNALPRPLAELLEPYATDDSARAKTADAAALKEALTAAAEAAFGAPRYVPLLSPRWTQSPAAQRG